VIDHWTGRGRIGVRVEAVDTKSGALIDTFAAGGGFDNQADVSVNGADQVDRSQLPTREQIENKLISDIAVQFAKRYNPGLEEVEIPLSVADELRAGNKLAKAGDYHAALQSWEASVPRKLDAMGDKHHNAGCFHEMMAYGLLRESGGTNLSGTQEELSKAMELYSQALRQDPKEKYFQQAVDRIRRASGVVDRLRSSQAAYEQAIASLRPASAWPPFAPAGKKNAVAAQEVEVDKTAQFRELVQARLKALESKSTPEVEA
jgi:tetratricopeptide (TPR) repeat protein